MANFLYAQAPTATSKLLFSRLASLSPYFDKSEYLETFASLETNVDRVNFVYKDLRKFKIFPKYEKRLKNDTDSQVIRKLGNEHFVKGYYKIALQLYTSSILAAKSAGVLALSYANRSICLYKLGKYQECLTDIERAISHNYPENRRLKLIVRRQHARNMLALSRPPQSYHEDTPQLCDFEKHPHIQCAKSCVAIKTNEEFGRHVVATRDIEIGEILCIEKPYAHLLVEQSEIHCHMCLELCYNTIPCDGCRFLLFCSEDCKNQANNSFHKYECPIIAALEACGVIRDGFVALRTALSAKEDYDQLDATNVDIEEYLSNRYKEIHNLMSGTNRFGSKRLHELAVLASVMYHFLQKHTEFFNEEKTKSIFQEVILLQLQIALINGIPIQENKATGLECEKEAIGLGLYSFSSLFNHSCCPNVEEIHYGSTLVLRTLNTIKKDQQCFVSYGLAYGDVPKVVRQEYLKKYALFDCVCDACKKNWPVSTDRSLRKRPLFLDLQMSGWETVKMKFTLFSNNVDAAKIYLPHLITQLKRCEDFEPMGNAREIKRLLAMCYCILGNKRFREL